MVGCRSNGRQTAAMATSALSASAMEFTPLRAPKDKARAPGWKTGASITPLAADASEFVPGRWGWSSQQLASQGIAGQWDESNGDRGPLAWPYDSGNEAFQPGPASIEGSVATHADGGDALCWFNADAYSAESSSPRGSDTAVPDSDTGVPESDAGVTCSEIGVPAVGDDCERSHMDAGDDLAVADMSERTMKEWLKRFADNGDVEILWQQWRVWTEAATAPSVGETDAETPAPRITAMAWLLRRGLDDCRCAEPVVSAVTQLLGRDPTLRAAAESSLEEFSEEDLEDLALDNPRVGEFVEAFRKAIAAASARSADAPAHQAAVAPPPPARGSGASAGGNETEASPSCTYPRELLLAARMSSLAAKAAAATSGKNGYEALFWRAEPVSNLEKTLKLPPSPSMAPRRSQRGAQANGSAHAANGPRPGGGGAAHRHSDGNDWREARAGSAAAARSNGIRVSAPEALMKSPTSWSAQVRRSRDSKDGLDEATLADEAFLREVRGTLNKLTVEKFDQLSEKLLDLIAQSTRPNRGIPVIMQLVFEKATTQHHFINMYVGFCVKLHRWLTENEQKVFVESQNNFKRILLNQCQHSFEQYLEPPEGFDGLSGEMVYESQVKYKTRMLGNIKLVGELIRHGMLVSKIAIAVSEELIRDDPRVREERLETLAVFLETVGPALDDPSWTHYQALTGIFSKVEQITNETGLPCRIRCLLQDVLDLRRCRWQAKKARSFDADAPSTIAEVHQRARQGVNSSGRGIHAERSVGAAMAQQPEGAPTYVGKSSSACSSTASLKPAASPQVSSSPLVPKVPTSPLVKPTPLALQKASAQHHIGATSSPAATAASTVVAPLRASGIAGPAGAAAPLAGAGATAAAVPSGAAPPPDGRNRQEVLQRFHKEVASVVRQVGSGKLDLGDGVARLRGCGTLPQDCELEEAADLVARIVDEPRAARQRLLPLLPALTAAGVLAAPSLLSRAVESFAEEAFADPADVDPPDLSEIVTRELLPALGLTLGALRLPTCLCGGSNGVA